MQVKCHFLTFHLLRSPDCKVHMHDGNCSCQVISDQKLSFHAKQNLTKPSGITNLISTVL